MCLLLLESFVKVFIYLTVISCANGVVYVPPDRRIVGGHPVIGNEFPFFAWIKVKNSLICGATIISLDMILTSAHCFDEMDLNDIRNYTEICAGTIDIDDIFQQVCRIPKTVIQHPGYNNFTLDNDIALIQVSNPFPRTSRIRPITLKTENDSTGRTCVTLGYGNTASDSDGISSHLMYVRLPIIPTFICAMQYLLHNIKISSTMLCAGYLFGGKDACYGDSGGPLICDNQLTGIVSFGLSCAKWLRPGVYTDVTRFIDWIEQNTGLQLRNTNQTSIFNRGINNNRSFLWLMIFFKKYTFSILIVLLHFQLRDLLAEDLEEDGTFKIMGGNETAPHEFPFHVSLTWPPGSDYFCGGVLITPKHVLTAAHCVITDYGWHMGPEHIIIIAGRNFLNESGVVRLPSKITPHENYTIATKQNDVAIIELQEPFELSKKINTIPLINYRVRPLSKCTAIGFGAPNASGPPTTNHLMKVEVPVQSMLRCRLLFAKRVQIFNGMMCAGYVTGRRDACSGDSGGPFVCANQLGGIVSAGIGCGIFYNPGIYSDVVYFRPWIDRVLAESNTILPHHNFMAPSSTTPSTLDMHSHGSTLSTLNKI
ncbi:transmembrane protease serine 9-like [Chrysoperla carnea]|uniref:transmembrane protease serine 9-like n=1 Tax=Chrysoperla carnea TaxID=189513 RepID=UPI001D094191|nr:transmembrane protease serine 9-like [Chrysoperla carnea]